ncbi:MAG: hypothetical protein QG620_765 [Patescibacteria group bacterium]|nr:hypothetical protein [Patescibacteria group bacterium]
MANINLITDKNDSTAIIGKGLAWVIVAFVLTLCLYGGLVFYKNSLIKNIVSTKLEYDTGLAQFKAGGAKDVADFQNRLDIADVDLAKGRSVAADLTEVEKSMITDAYLNSYEFDEKTKEISLECATDNYNAVARQILNFKSSGYFSGVTAGETSLDAESGEIIFPVNLTLK